MICQKSRGFSFAELLAVMAVGVILLGILVPYVAKLQEADCRYRCLDNLGQLYAALNTYSRSNGGVYPRTPEDPSRTGYTCFTGADDPNPFARDSHVAGNDVTASLWLLVRGGLCSPRLFVCPSTDAVADDGASNFRRSNFRSADSLSYSYACPFGRAPEYRLNDTRRSGFALMADLNPGPPPSGVYPPVSDNPLAQAAGNSLNHRRAGQNVLYADGHVAFAATAYCGVDRDNIYTALDVRPIERSSHVHHDLAGVQSMSVGPAWDSDSDLVPTARDTPPK